MLATRLQLPHVELDALKYGPSWSEASDSDFAANVAQIAQGERWVIDGNYEVVRPRIWKRCDLVVWVDYPLPLTLWRLLSRTAFRLITRETFANGNREQLRRLMSRRSVIAWAVRSHEARRRHYEKQLLEPCYRHLQVERLRSPASAANLVCRLSRSTSKGAQ
jgi:adenylate kinase family enzyme